MESKPMFTIRKADKSQLRRMFQDGDIVQMRVIEKSASGTARMTYKKFIIDTARINPDSNKYEYLLRSEAINEIYEKSTWFPEDKLRMR